MRLLVLGAGSMAAQHAEAFIKIDGAEIVAVVDPHPERLTAFADQFGIAHRFGTSPDASTGTRSTLSPTSRRWQACVLRKAAGDGS